MGDSFDHAIQWLVGVASAATIAISGAIVKLWRHEERIKALESLHRDQADTLASVSEKIDKNHEAITDRLAGAVEDIRADLRIITQRCLTVMHSDDGK
jgi:hypothetical protein